MSKRNMLIIFLIIFIFLIVQTYFHNQSLNNEKLKDPDFIANVNTGNLWQNEIYTKEEKQAFHDGVLLGKVQNWEMAQSYCSSLTIDGLSGWELPTISELEEAYSISVKFKENPGWVHWSSSSVENYPSSAYCLDFNGGRIYQCTKNKTAYVKCMKRVR